MSEEEFWAIDYQEFTALVERNFDRMDFLEHCGALGAWMTFNVNRGKNAPYRSWEDFMPRRAARLRVRPMKQDGRPAAAPQRSQQPVMRFAKPGERPPSRYAPGNEPDVIANLDAWSRSRFGGKPNGNR